MSDPRPMNDPRREPGYVPPEAVHPTAQRVADTRSTPGLISDLINHVTELFRKEMMLFRAEINEKTTQVTSAGGMLAGALVFGIVGLIFLSGTVMLAIIAAGLSPVWAALIVGAALTLLAVVMGMTGKNRLSAASLAPNRTIHAVQRDAAAAKERVK